MSGLFVLLFLLSVVNPVIGADSKKHSQQRAQLKEKLESDEYDRLFAPIAFHADGSSSAVPVKASVIVRSLSGPNLRKRSFDVSLDIDQQWTDSRLAYALDEPNAKALPIGDEKTIWLPDLFFVNSVKSSKAHSVIRVYPNGTVWSIDTYAVTLPCESDLSSYPFDQQECQLQFGSLSHDDDELAYDWESEEGSVWLMDLVDVPGYDLMGYAAEQTTHEFPTGNFTHLRITFQFKREFGFCIAHFLPSAGVILLAWLALWIPRRSTESRVFVASVALLIITALAILARYDLPRDTFFSALDVWYLVCTLFVGFSLLAIVLIASSSSCSSTGKESRQLLAEDGTAYREASTKSGGKAGRIECASRVLYLIGFIIFCVLYYFCCIFRH